jgi:hypothetical protein
VAVIKSGASTDQLTIDATSKAGRSTLYGSDGVELKNKKTYAASGAFTPSATPQDLVMIFGSATKTVRVQSIKIGTANTAAGSQIFTLKKRSAVSTGGTVVAATAVPLDSSDAAATATVSHLTTSANTPGTSVGTLVTKSVASPAVTPATWAGITEDSDREMLPFVGEQTKAVVLRGVAEGLAINFAGAALVSGQIHTYNVVWTEE